jgi:hypothetical protein
VEWEKTEPVLRNQSGFFFVDLGGGGLNPSATPLRGWQREKSIYNMVYFIFQTKKLMKNIIRWEQPIDSCDRRNRFFSIKATIP